MKHSLPRNEPFVIMISVVTDTSSRSLQLFNVDQLTVCVVLVCDPQCSYSACDGETYEDNVETMLLEMNNWRSKLSSGKAFSCYVDAISSSVLLNVNYSWSLAFNSVLWVAGLNLAPLAPLLLLLFADGRENKSIDIEVP